MVGPDGLGDHEGMGARAEEVRMEHGLVPETPDPVRQPSEAVGRDAWFK
jgi:hypothetical protein